MLSGRGRGRGGTSPGVAAGSRAAGLRSAGGGGGAAARSRGGAAVLSRSSSRSPARGAQAAAAASGRRGAATKAASTPVSPKVKKKLATGKTVTEENKTVNDNSNDATEKASKTDPEKSSPVTKTVRKKLPKLNDNPDAPEVVDVPNMRSSYVERLTDNNKHNAASATSENGTNVNGDKLDLKESSEKQEVTFAEATKMPLIVDEEKSSNVSVNKADQFGESADSANSAAAANNNSSSKSDPIVLIPLFDENSKDKSDTDDKDVITKDVTEEDSVATDSDSDLLTKMIRENLNKAVNDSNDSTTSGSDDDMKQSLLNAIKNTFKSSNSNSPRSKDADESFQDDIKPEELSKVEETIVNGTIVNGVGVHGEENIDEEVDEKSELEMTGDNSIAHDKETVGEEEAKDIDYADLIEKAEVEISPGPEQVSGDIEVPLTASADGINDLIVDAQSNVLPKTESNEENPKEDSSKVAIPLDQLENGMVAVESVQVEQIVDGEAIIESLDEVPKVMEAESEMFVVITHKDAVEKPKLNIDKNKLFSQMNDTFAKDTHQALKNRPVYQKRPRPSEETVKVDASEETIKDDTEEKQSPPTKKKKLKSKQNKKVSSYVKENAKEDVVKDLQGENDIDLDSATNNDKGKELQDENDIDLDSVPHEDQSKELQEEDDIDLDSVPNDDKSKEIITETMKDENEDEDDEDSKPLPNVQMADADDDESSDGLENNVSPDNNTVPDNMDLEEDVKKKNDDENKESVEEDSKGDDEICDNPLTTNETDEVPTGDDEQLEEPVKIVKDLPVTEKDPHPPTLVPVNSSSELTKSLRKVRLTKKSPSKPPSFEKSFEEEPSEDESSLNKSRNSSSPSKDLSSSIPKAGTEVFDFTDEEDLPLSNIDLDVLDAANSNGDSNLQITIPEPQPTLDHELSQLTPKSTRTPRRGFEVSPQILTAVDAVAAVAALQVSQEPGEDETYEAAADTHHGLPAGDSEESIKMNGAAAADTLSDDTDTSLNVKSNHAFEKGKVAKRKKRRVTESDGGDTEDDLENGKKDLRPKRIKESSLRPASAASGTSVTSDDRRDLEDIKRLRDHDGKITPDSQKGSDDKSITKVFSTVVPEKASSFKIHPERTCADCCFYCNLKFGMLDTPMHIAQLKTIEKQEFAMEFTRFDRDACLCDRCFRFLDRRAQARDMNGAKSIADGVNVKEDKVKKCLVRTCNRQVTNQVSKKWLIRLKKKLSKKVGIDWERVAKASVKATFPMCPKHNALIEFYSNCGLCKRKLTVGGICTLGMSHKEVEEMNVLLREDHIPADLKENNFVCKLCKTFCGIKQKSLQPDYLKNHKTYKAFYKDYRRKLYIYLELGEDDKSIGKFPKKQFKVSQSDSGCKITISAHTPDMGSEKKKKKEKELLSPSDESKIHVVNDASPDFKKSPSIPEKCSVSINFDLNTKKLWQDLHYPYGNYTSFFRHLILLEKYWRSGDLTIAPGAGVKASSYLSSVGNRIKSYQEKQYQSKEDLSACTRPDLNQPAAPQLIHIPGEAVLANLPISSPSPKMTEMLKSPDSSSSNSTILKIPKVPRSSNAGLLLSPGPSPETQVTPTGPKIRVRQDLMNHLGLVAKPNLVTTASVSSSMSPISSTPAPTKSHLRAALTVTPVSAPAPSHSTPNLAKLLSEGPGLSGPAGSSAVSPPDPAPLRSSNSQLFKSTESTGAIPLTFNNSIAEVLAAASKAKNAKSREPSPKPEITITAKSSNKTKDLSQVLAAASKTPTGGHKLPASITTPSPSGGGLSILKRSVSSASPATSISPLSNMTKLLQAQTPGLPPHIIAQQTLTAKSASPKVMSRPPGPVMSNLRPVQISGNKPPQPLPQGIQTVNKKSLNTVLDRLGGLGTSTAPVKNSSSGLSSSLVQQLQAPPMTSRPGPKSYKEGKAAMIRTTSSSNTNVTSSTGQPTLNVPPIAQPMVQFPVDPANLLSQSLLLGPNPAAAQAALMMAGLNGLTPVQAQQAMQELLQQQQQLMSGGAPPQQLMSAGAPQQLSQARMRAPPPLKNMSTNRKPD